MSPYNHYIRSYDILYYSLNVFYITYWKMKKEENVLSKLNRRKGVTLGNLWASICAIVKINYLSFYNLHVHMRVFIILRLNKMLLLQCSGVTQTWKVKRAILWCFLMLMRRPRRRRSEEKEIYTRIREIFKSRKLNAHYYYILLQEMRLNDRECHFR